MVRLGLGLMVVAAVLLALLDRALGPSATCCPSCCFTAGYALFQTANNSAVVGRRRGEPWRRGWLLTLSRNLGQLTGAAGLGPVRSPGRAARSPSRRRTSWRLPPGPPSPLTALLLMSALWLAGREERAVQDDADPGRLASRKNAENEDASTGRRLAMGLAG